MLTRTPRLHRHATRHACNMALSGSPSFLMVRSVAASGSALDGVRGHGAADAREGVRSRRVPTPLHKFVAVRVGVARRLRSYPRERATQCTCRDPNVPACLEGAPAFACQRRGVQVTALVPLSQALVAVRHVCALLLGSFQVTYWIASRKYLYPNKFLMLPPAV
ncbi:hypothetical protein H4582DRAFT_727494 [Lactarius indigo]|nr:hypothetical protein H4582DRAFT_727494 [Lactarius indigo]